jgi:tryptophanyl-tRNA synthetase
MSVNTVLSGMRPTGPLHVGHYVGVIKNWIELQKTHPCFIFLADWHALTSNFDNTQVIKESRYEYVKAWIASGVNPEKAHIFTQSEIPEVLKLSQIFLCLTPPGWADRSPSWKDFQGNENADRKLDNLGFYTYPILQAADIAIVKGKYVPVGEDQVTHIEIAREVVRKFNRTYKTNLPEPEPMLTKVPKLLGLDGTKMSSSKGNVIGLKDDEKSLQKKINKIKTDDQRGGVENPGNPDNCCVFDFHKVFSQPAVCASVNEACRSAQISCGECKAKLGLSMKEELLPISEKIAKITNNEVDDILRDGNRKVGAIAKSNWEELQSAMKF